MKATGMIRRVDELGRIVIPAEIRYPMGIKIKDPLAIYVDDKYIILKKYQPACVLCDNAEDMIEYKGKNICKECIDEMPELYRDVQ